MNKVVTMRLFSFCLLGSMMSLTSMPTGVGGEDAVFVSNLKPPGSRGLSFRCSSALNMDLQVPNDPVGFHSVGDALVGVPTQEMMTSSFGKTVAISSSGGNRLLVGAPTHGFSAPTADDSQVNQGGGAVFLYELNESAMEWELVWFLPGYNREGLGKAVSISADGSRVAIRRRRHSNNNVLDFVEVYEIQGNEVSRNGSPIGCMGGGSGLSLAPSGDRVAVSCESFDSGRGRVEVFDYVAGDVVVKVELLEVMS